ncbi:NAD(P)-binding domain-containing protein [Candidatus Puniceispirillum sp.]|nr:NAD(P)-binding domain-containing protein [Candidatus Puniceispirillum sp.]
MEQKILFIGLGIMGAPMAENIIQKGFDVAVCDIQQNVVDGFKGIASITSTKPSEAADQRNVIMMILPNSDVVNSVLFDEGGRSGNLCTKQSYCGYVDRLIHKIDGNSKACCQTWP